MIRLKDKVAVVTGASSGIGRATSLLFAKEGASVVAVARRKERLYELAEQAEKQGGGPIVAFPGDITNKEDVENMLALAVERFGRLDVLVNNAGVMDEMTPVGEVEDELWNRVITINLTGPFYACREAVKLMVDQEAGNIINVASVGGIGGSRAGTSYTASKFGLVGMTKNIAYQYALKGIRCNAICPGGVDTEIGVGIANPSPFGIERVMAGAQNNPRSGTAEEIANIALFLASEESSFVNGAILVADAGWTAY